MRHVDTSGRIALIGGGGHAKMVIGALQAAGYRNFSIYDDRLQAGTTVLGAPVIGKVAAASASDCEGALLCISDNAVRMRLAALSLPWMTLVHPSAWVHDSVSLGIGAVVFAGTIVQPD